MHYGVPIYRNYLRYSILSKGKEEKVLRRRAERIVINENGRLHGLYQSLFWHGWENFNFTRHLIEQFFFWLKISQQQ